MARLLIFWTQPAHMPAAEADAWVRGELRRIMRVTDIERAHLTRLHAGSERFGAPHDWMLELRLAPGIAAAEYVEAEPCAQLLGDLRLLGMRPAVVVADSDLPLAGGEG